jgi:hypothetical protein
LKLKYLKITVLKGRSKSKENGSVSLSHISVFGTPILEKENLKILGTKKILSFAKDVLVNQVIFKIN